VKIDIPSSYDMEIGIRNSWWGCSEIATNLTSELNSIIQLILSTAAFRFCLATTRPAEALTLMPPKALNKKDHVMKEGKNADFCSRWIILRAYNNFHITAATQIFTKEKLHHRNSRVFMVGAQNFKQPKKSFERRETNCCTTTHLLTGNCRITALTN